MSDKKLKLQNESSKLIRLCEVAVQDSRKYTSAQEDLATMHVGPIVRANAGRLGSQGAATG